MLLIKWLSKIHNPKHFHQHIYEHSAIIGFGGGGVKFYEAFPALSHKNFRMFWTGQIVSLIGTWMQNAALSWLVYSITNDRFLLGLMTAVQFTPMFLFSLFAGIIIEKYPKRKVIMTTQALQLVLSFILFILVFTGTIKYSFILVIVFMIGTVQSIDNPARQSFVVEMVDGRKNLLNAIALNSAAFNGARLIGPGIAGFLMTGFGPKWCFFINSISFIAVLAGLFMMNIEDKPSRNNIGDPIGDIIEGINYIIKTPKLFYTFISVIVIPTFCLNFNVLLPPYTKDVLNMQANGFGGLMSTIGFGAFVGALTVATKIKRERIFKYQLIGALGLSVFLIIMGFVRFYSGAMIILTLCGFSMVIYNSLSNSILQLNAPDEMRGRIMSVYSLIFGGLTPVGAIYTGYASKHLGTQATFIISGIIGLSGVVILFVKRQELK
jgi:MFS family permease